MNNTFRKIEAYWFACGLLMGLGLMLFLFPFMADYWIINNIKSDLGKFGHGEDSSAVVFWIRAEIERLSFKRLIFFTIGIFFGIASLLFSLIIRMRPVRE